MDRLDNFAFVLTLSFSNHKKSSFMPGLIPHRSLLLRRVFEEGNLADGRDAAQPGPTAYRYRPITTYNTLRTRGGYN